MKCIQVLLACAAIASVSARALPAESTLDTDLTARDAKQELSSSDLSDVDSIVEGLTGKDPGLKEREVEVINAAHFPTLASRKKHNGTSTTNAALTTGSAAAAAKASKKAAKAAAKSSESAAEAATATASPTAAAAKREFEGFPELESRKKHNGTATSNNAATITDPAALASQSAAKAAKKAAKSSKKAAAAAASATASVDAVRRDLEIMAGLESRKKHNGTATSNTAATITDPAALASESAAKAAKKAAKSSKKAAAAAASATASVAAVRRDLEIMAGLESRKKHNGTATSNTAATITDPAALASASAAKAAKKAAKSSKKAAAAAAASATASASTIQRDLELVADLNRRRTLPRELTEEEEDVADAVEELDRRFHSADTRVVIGGTR